MLLPPTSFVSDYPDKFAALQANAKVLMWLVTECDISSRDFSVSRLFSIFWEYRSRSRKFWSRKKVSVSVSKIFSLEKKSRYRSRKYLVSKKSLGIGLENFGLKKSLGIGLENFGLKKSLSNDLKKFVLENFGLQKLWTW